jgi:hypothetical protein
MPTSNKKSNRNRNRNRKEVNSWFNPSGNASNGKKSTVLFRNTRKATSPKRANTSGSHGKVLFSSKGKK